jgi:predicted metal-dependent HD superfamily phosphohydrolase
MLTTKHSKIIPKSINIFDYIYGMNSILEKTKEYVAELLSEKLASEYVYHSLAHTKRVVEKAEELAELAKLDKKKRTLLSVAAWFHDTGFINVAKGHEEESVIIASNFLKNHNVDEEDIQIISNLIRVTKLEKQPETELECYIKDADCAYVSSDEYEIYAKKLKEEWEATTDLRFSDREWLKNNIDFICNHKFYSKIAIQHWGQKKDENISSLLLSYSKNK